MTIIWYLLAVAAVYWLGMILTAGAALSGLPFAILAVLFAVLKLAGIIEWSWWWALLPLWGAFGGVHVKMWAIKRDPMWRFRR